jgi:hypothetical protein
MKRLSPGIRLVGVGAAHVAVDAKVPVKLDGGSFGFETTWSGRMMHEVGGIDGQ